MKAHTRAPNENLGSLPHRCSKVGNSDTTFHSEAEHGAEPEGTPGIGGSRDRLWRDLKVREITRMNFCLRELWVATLSKSRL